MWVSTPSRQREFLPTGPLGLPLSIRPPSAMKRNFLFATRHILRLGLIQSRRWLNDGGQEARSGDKPTNRARRLARNWPGPSNRILS